MNSLPPSALVALKNLNENQQGKIPDVRGLSCNSQYLFSPQSPRLFPQSPYLKELDLSLDALYFNTFWANPKNHPVNMNLFKRLENLNLNIGNCNDINLTQLIKCNENPVPLKHLSLQLYFSSFYGPFIVDIEFLSNIMPCLKTLNIKGIENLKEKDRFSNCRDILDIQNIEFLKKFSELEGLNIISRRTKGNFFQNLYSNLPKTLQRISLPPVEKELSLPETILPLIKAGENLKQIKICSSSSPYMFSLSSKDFHNILENLKKFSGENNFLVLGINIKFKGEYQKVLEESQSNKKLIKTYFKEKGHVLIRPKIKGLSSVKFIPDLPKVSEPSTSKLPDLPLPDPQAVTGVENKIKNDYKTGKIKSKLGVLQEALRRIDN